MELTIRIRCALLVLLSLHCETTRGENLDGEFGILTSDDFPRSYPDNINRTWNINVLPGYKVRLQFTVFDLEDSYEEESGACPYDYVQIEGYKRLCGNYSQFPYDAPRPNQVFKSAKQMMTVRFVSDYANEGYKPVGFQAHFRSEDRDECEELRKAVHSDVEEWDKLLYCNHGCHNTPGSYYCSCRHGFTLHSNQHTCIADCPDDVIFAGQGFLTSSDYPQPYSKLANCTRVIRAEIGYSIEIRFDNVFDIEDHYEVGCSYDWVMITREDGTWNKYCGATAPRNGSWIYARSAEISVQFHTDLTLEKSGYKIYYRKKPFVCDPLAVVVPVNGTKTNDTSSGNSYVYNDTVTFECDIGYRLNGSHQMRCSDKGKWNGTSPACEIKRCNRPEHLLNISKSVVLTDVGDEPEYGTILHISCIEWYGIISGSGEWKCGDDEEWHPQGNIISNISKDNIPVCRPLCGIKNMVKGTILGLQILGGKRARFGEWPWMAYLDNDMRGAEWDKYFGAQWDKVVCKRGLKAKNGFFCGGSLVEEQYVVTAAHCVDGKNGFKVYLGVTNRGNRTNRYKQIFTAVNITIHDNYTKNKGKMISLLNNDIAVIKLDRPVTIGKYVRPICIPRRQKEKELPERGSQNQAGYQGRGVVIGWGLTELKKSSMHLNMVRVPFVNSTACQKAYKNQSGSHEYYPEHHLTSNMICAGFLDKLKDSCIGDSGGPYMFRDLTSNKWYLNGIVSYGTSFETCNNRSILGIYTKVGNYIEFLANHFDFQ